MLENFGQPKRPDRARLSFGVGFSFLIAQLAADHWGWRSAFLLTGGGPVAMVIACLLMQVRRPETKAGPLLNFKPVIANREALGYVLGYGAHCFELYGIRTWLVGFWTFVVGHQGAPSWLTPVVMSFVFAIISMPASILGNEAALRFGRRRAITIAMIASACVALVIGLNATAPAWLLATLLLVYRLTVPADSGALTAGMAAAAEPAHRGATMALHSTVGFGLSAAGAWGTGVALDAAGGPGTATGWLLALVVLAIGISLGPVALMWSRTTRSHKRLPAESAGIVGTYNLHEYETVVDRMRRGVIFSRPTASSTCIDTRASFWGWW
jgi:predicted MFS family arabinose efflux permease